MDKETLEAASRLLRTVLGDLGVSSEVTELIQQIVERAFDSLSRRGMAPGGPTLTDELRAESQRAFVNVAAIAHLVLRAGASPEHVRSLVRDHLLRQAEREQHLIGALLALPRQDHATTLH